MEFSSFKKNKSDKFVKLLVKNKGNYVYYIAFTDEIRLSKKKEPNGELILQLDKIRKLNLGPITYIGEL